MRFNHLLPRALGPGAQRQQVTILLIICSVMLSACSTQAPVVSVQGGRLQGVPSGQSGVTVFKGIPYAAPPLGDLRWQTPQPAAPWEGVKVCDSFGPICPQPGNKPGTFYGDEFYWAGTPEENEDCLYLNVWAPTRTLGKTQASLPVALWIHGGAFRTATPGTSPMV